MNITVYIEYCVYEYRTVFDLKMVWEYIVPLKTVYSTVSEKNYVCLYFLVFGAHK